MNKYAFTLAEVMITLGIIGIIAAVTISTINANIRGKKLQTQFNKTYSDLNQAANTFYVDTGMTVKEYQDSVYNGSVNSNAVLIKFMSYFNGYNDSNYHVTKYDTKFGLKNLNLNGEAISNYPCDGSNAILDISGRIYSSDDMVSPESNRDLKICVDINGNNKPNRWGVDRFVFVVTTANNIVEPYTGTGWQGSGIQHNGDGYLKLNQSNCSTTMTAPAFSCAYFALRNISPEGNGDYWNDFLKGKY